MSVGGRLNRGIESSRHGDWAGWLATLPKCHTSLERLERGPSGQVTRTGEAMRGQGREERAAVGGLAAPSRAVSGSFLRLPRRRGLAAEVDLSPRQDSDFLACRQTSSMRAGPRMKTDGAESGRRRGGRAKAARSPGKLGGGRMRRRTAERLAFIKAALGRRWGDWASMVSLGMILPSWGREGSNSSYQRQGPPPLVRGGGAESGGGRGASVAERRAEPPALSAPRGRCEPGRT
ncbi:hypothetical protein THAOC_00446 [Thalassiosira oceanica]|uniref:Uncharacterized protein n=1 Tax=Thalassiosira oceanica TaxID=159749 RepID=K0TG91_THAOC|nr:hypothetical protein THAOC_00446 [Thalassiosira oceanica]|eukprot:EJK77708.1 hypothetical protein THAOC_00446 [Thalassiosira oceanica]